jgi:hypothetical protein
MWDGEPSDRRVVLSLKNTIAVAKAAAEKLDLSLYFGWRSGLPLRWMPWLQCGFQRLRFAASGLN